MPQIIEKGLRLMWREYDVGCGVADLVFKDSKDRFLIVEVELTARESSIGQICKLHKCFCDKHGLPLESVRKAIVAVFIKGGVVDACLSANIEFYLLKAYRLA